MARLSEYTHTYSRLHMCASGNMCFYIEKHTWCLGLLMFSSKHVCEHAFFHKTHRAQCTAHRACQLLCKSYLKCFKWSSGCSEALSLLLLLLVLVVEIEKPKLLSLRKERWLQSAKVGHPAMTLREAPRAPSWRVVDKKRAKRLQDQT